MVHNPVHRPTEKGSGVYGVMWGYMEGEWIHRYATTGLPVLENVLQSSTIFYNVR